MAEKIPVKKLKDGDKVASDVLDDSGNVILGAGTKISERFISILEKRGIKPAFRFAQTP